MDVSTSLIEQLPCFQALIFLSEADLVHVKHCSLEDLLDPRACLERWQRFNSAAEQRKLQEKLQALTEQKPKSVLNLRRGRQAEKLNSLHSVSSLKSLLSENTK